MERGSNKHGPMMDDEMKRETRAFEQGQAGGARVEEHRQHEAPGDDEPVPDAVLHGERFEPAEGTLSRDEAETRSRLAQVVGGETLPAGRDRLVEVARERHAPGWMVSMLMKLPEDREFENLQDVWEALGGHTERRTA